MTFPDKVQRSWWFRGPGRLAKACKYQGYMGYEVRNSAFLGPYHQLTVEQWVWFRLRANLRQLLISEIHVNSDRTSTIFACRARNFAGHHPDGLGLVRSLSSRVLCWRWPRERGRGRQRRFGIFKTDRQPLRSVTENPGQKRDPFDGHPRS